MSALSPSGGNPLHATTNQRPGLGVTADMTQPTQIGEVTEPGRRNVLRRPDGSLTHL